MERARKPFVFSDGREISVEESTWESASRRSSMIEQIQAEKAKLNGSGDPVLFYFVETYYSYLSSCSVGSIPSAEEALKLEEDDLDRWFESIVEVNPESFLPVDRRKEGEAIFRDGSSFRIRSSYLPSVSIRRARLEAEALKREEDPKNPKDVFAVYLYPLLASCSVGEIPSAEAIRSTWPETEIYKWRDAVREVNPQWFESDEELRERADLEIENIQKKSQKRRRR